MEECAEILIAKAVSADFCFSSRRRHTRCALVTGVQTCALPISSPVQAQPKAGDYRCAGLADQARTAADAMQTEKQSSAKRFVATGNKLCEAGNERAAAKQYRAALKIAGVAEVETDSQMAAR